MYKAFTSTLLGFEKQCTERSCSGQGRIRNRGLIASVSYSILHPMRGHETDWARRIGAARTAKEVGTMRITGTVLVIAMLWGCCWLAAGVPVINEVAWAGSAASASDEWIELHNPDPVDVDLSGWTLRFGDTVIHLGRIDGNTRELRATAIPAGGFFVLERSDDETISDRPAEGIYTGALSNGGVTLHLLDPDGNEVDAVPLEEDGWPGGSTGSGSPPWCTLERIDPHATGASGNWGSNNGIHRTGLDADGVAINGTPGAENSLTSAARSQPTARILYPNEDGLVLSGSVVVRWEARDPDGDDAQLRIDLLVVGDDGESTPIAERLGNGGAYTWDTLATEDGTHWRLCLIATDPEGFTTRVCGAVFSMANGP
jgi:hypothetical protein